MRINDYSGPDPRLDPGSGFDCPEGPYVLVGPVWGPQEWLPYTHVKEALAFQNLALEPYLLQDPGEYIDRLYYPRASESSPVVAHPEPQPALADSTPAPETPQEPAVVPVQAEPGPTTPTPDPNPPTKPTQASKPPTFTQTAESKAAKNTNPNAFIHLHNHSEHSPLDGLIRIGDLPSLAASDGASHVALTDHGSIDGWYRFHDSASKAGIIPIFGEEMYLAIGDRFNTNDFIYADRSDASGEGEDEAKQGRKKKTYYHLTVLAGSEIGYTNLLRMHNAAEDSYHRVPRIDYDLLKEYGEGLIVLTGCVGGPVASSLAKPVFSGAQELLEVMRVQGKLDAHRAQITQIVSDEVYKGAGYLKMKSLWDAMPSQAGVYDTAVTVLAASDHQADYLDGIAGAEGDPDSLWAALIPIEDELLGDAPGHSLVRELKTAPTLEAFERALAELTRIYSADNVDEAQKHLDRIIDAVGHDNVFVEVMDHGVGAELIVIEQLVELAKINNLPLIATNDCHYSHAEEAAAHDGWLCVRTKDTVDNPNRKFKFNGSGYHYRSTEEMLSLREEDWWKQACANTRLVADRITEDYTPKPVSRLPHFPFPPEYGSSENYLRFLALQGLLARFGEDPATPGYPAQIYLDRLEEEVPVIAKAGTIDYFLILWDLMEWVESDRGLPTPEFPRGKPGQKKPIRRGKSRGSAGGSLLSYSLRITDIDPIDHRLLFERFLNPERAGLPDIDSDFEKERVGEVLAYLMARYGQTHVARIGTFTINKSKGALKDAGRVLGQATAGIKLSESIPIVGAKAAPLKYVFDTPVHPGPNATPKELETFEEWTTVHEMSGPSRKLMADFGEEGQRVLEIARSMENMARTVSTHACATLVSDQPLEEIVPLRYQRDKQGRALVDLPRIVGWEGGSVEAMGLLKLDILAIKTLDIITLALDYAGMLEGSAQQIPELKAREIPSGKSARAFEEISRGNTAGTFQLGSRGMQELAKDVAPQTLDDLTALVALYRPGPMGAGMHTMYAARKNGREAVSYDYLTNNAAEVSVISSVLDATYGLVVYQEQLQQLGGAIGGLGPGMRNTLQKAFSKKKKELMDQVKTAVYAGALKGDNPTGTTHSVGTLDALWRTFEASAEYLFNRSHAAGYGVTAFETAYLKANWPTAYDASVLANEPKAEKRRPILRSLQEEGIQIYAPDVNHSELKTAPYQDGVIIGLSEIKGVGKGAEAIIKERHRGGMFTSFINLTTRIEENKTKEDKITNATYVGLVEAGAMDSFGPRMSLFMAAKGGNYLGPVVEWGVLEKDLRQRRRLGYTAGEHPLRALGNQAAQSLPVDYQEGCLKTRPMRDVLTTIDGASVSMVALLTQLEKRTGRKSRFATWAFESPDRSEITGIQWQSDLEDMEALGNEPSVGDIVLVRGKVRHKKFEYEVTNEDGSTQIRSVEQTELNVRQVDRLDVADNFQLLTPVPQIR